MTDIGALLDTAAEFGRSLDNVKSREQPSNGWYPYGTLANLWHLEQLLTGSRRDLHGLIGDRPVADIGAADGDMAYLLRHLGFSAEIIDNPPTNFNGLNGARLLGDLLDMDVPIHEVDLDTQFWLPRDDYGLVLFLGTLYHLQNPFFVLDQLSRHARHAALSTKVAQQTADGSVHFGAAPVAYLVDPTESNADHTNYWIFTLPCLRRLVQRTGWEIVDERTVGRTEGDSDPSHVDRDERTFMLLKSNR